MLPSVQFSCSVMSNSLWPHGLQHGRPPCPSPTPEAYSNSCPLSWWSHPTISSSVIPFSSRLQSFRASGPFQMSQCFTSGGQSIGVSASALVLPMTIQNWFPLGWTGWISLLSKGLYLSGINITVLKVLRHFSHCLSLQINVASCDGKCPSATIYNINIESHLRFCKCCRENGVRNLTVPLYCSGNGTEVLHTLQEPIDCTCQWN